MEVGIIIFSSIWLLFTISITIYWIYSANRVGEQQFLTNFLKASTLIISTSVFIILTIISFTSTSQTLFNINESIGYSLIVISTYYLYLERFRLTWRNVPGAGRIKSNMNRIYLVCIILITIYTTCTCLFIFNDNNIFYLIIGFICLFCVTAILSILYNKMVFICFDMLIYAIGFYPVQRRLFVHAITKMTLLRHVNIKIVCFKYYHRQYARKSPQMTSLFFGQFSPPLVIYYHALKLYLTNINKYNLVTFHLLQY